MDPVIDSQLLIDKVVEISINAEDRKEWRVVQRIWSPYSRSHSWFELDLETRKVVHAKVTRELTIGGQEVQINPWHRTKLMQGVKIRINVGFRKKYFRALNLSNAEKKAFKYMQMVEHLAMMELIREGKYRLEEI